MIVRFVDIGGLDDYHCLNFLLIGHQMQDNCNQRLDDGRLCKRYLPVWEISKIKLEAIRHNVTGTTSNYIQHDENSC